MRHKWRGIKRALDLEMQVHGFGTRLCPPKLHVYLTVTLLTVHTRQALKSAIAQSRLLHERARALHANEFSEAEMGVVMEEMRVVHASCRDAVEDTKDLQIEYRYVMRTWVCM
jgi:hypothetical protein